MIEQLSARLFACAALDPFLKKFDAGADANVGLPGSARPFFVASMFARAPRPMVVVISGEEAAAKFARGVASFVGAENVLHFQERRDVPWGAKPADVAAVGERACALGRLGAGEPLICVTSARALLRQVGAEGEHVFAPLLFEPGQPVVESATGELLEYEDLAPWLVTRGYERLDALAGPGTFTVQGDVVDIFAAGAPAPVRVEFWGDEIESVRLVLTTTGQTIRTLDAVEIFPACEFAEPGQPGASPLAHVAPNALVVAIEPRSLFDDANRRFDELLAAGQEAKWTKDEVEAFFTKPASMNFGSQQRVSLLSIIRAGGALDVELPLSRPELSGSEEKLVGNIRASLAAKNLTCFAATDPEVRKNFALLFSDEHIPFIESTREHPQPLRYDFLNLVDLDVPQGFVLKTAKFALLSVCDLSRHAAARRPARKVDITEVTFPFQPGDYVVHCQRGIARFVAIVNRDISGGARDYLQLEYAGGAHLYVPVEQIDKITRYVGPEGAAPRLTKLGGSDWTRAVGRAKKSAKKLAFDLVDLYSRRMTVKGYAYAVDDAMQHEMEEMFPFEEALAQLAAIAAFKADMESQRPMDRLLCGDVGFGKTEVALRAAFKAVACARQVMVLCPTTILASQHFTTFSERCEPFGVRVEVLSRFRSPKQQREALEGFAAGEVDILVGTHRLLSRDVNPRNLGLVIIDEEQRFGVGHKEKLKNLREHIDILTLSATPIPRTLQMSLSGVRDMSLITTPPTNRRPVKVHVGEWDEDVVSAAIRLEMERGGQCYYVSNRVRTIDDAVRRVYAAAPEARVGVAHGQMSEAALEEVMERFAAGELDVLVATTIVESGLDNPHTNTLIIEDSQRLGLAQLYQLKGRVGRSITQAYAYFLFPGDMPLTEEAANRLTAIGEFTELGSGMKVAMRDLEIRGAGSLLGADQSGNMSAVGFDLFASMIAEAVAEARGEEPIAHMNVTVDLPCNFRISEEYAPAADVRVAFYRRLAAAEGAEDADAIEADMRRSLGPVPDETVNMLNRARCKAWAAECGIERITVEGGRLVLGPVSPALNKKARANRDFYALLMRTRTLYTERTHSYKTPLAREENPLEVATLLLSELAKLNA